MKCVKECVDIMSLVSVCGGGDGTLYVADCFKALDRKLSVDEIESFEVV